LRAVSPAGIQIAALAGSTPDDHLITGPDRRVIESGIGRVGEAGWSPSIKARAFLLRCIRNPWKSVTTKRCSIYCARINWLAHCQADTLGSHCRLKQTLRQHWLGQALGYNKGIVSERFKKFAQHLWLLCVLCHPIHFGLQLVRSDWPLPVILQRL
jgi:hypothetical protein